MLRILETGVNVPFAVSFKDFCKSPSRVLCLLLLLWISVRVLLVFFFTLSFKDFCKGSLTVPLWGSFTGILKTSGVRNLEGSI